MIINDCIPIQQAKSTMYRIYDKTYVGGTFEKVSYIRTYCFASNSSLWSVNFPNCTRIGYRAFNMCTGLTYANFPNCRYIESSAFGYCTNLSKLSFPNCEEIGNYAFYQCSSLTGIWIGGSSVVSVQASNFLGQTPIASGQGYIHVPSSLYSAYLTASYWSYYSNYITSNGWN